MRVLVIGNLSESILRFRGELLRDMAMRGHEVHACGPGLLGDVTTRLVLEGMGIQCHEISLSRTGTGLVADLGSLCSMCQLMRRIRPDVVLAYTIKPVVYGLIAARMSGVQRRFALVNGLGYALADEISSWKRRVLRRTVLALYRIALSDAACVFFQNQEDARCFSDWGLLRGVPAVVVNGSGVPVDEYPAAPLPIAPVSFLLIARLLVEKGVCEYVAAARRVREVHPEVVFRLVGGVDSNAGSVTAEEVESWQRDGVIEWYGQLADVRPAIRQCHVFVLPSYYREGTPRTILEAMSMGRPVITTDMPGCRETVTSGENGFLVKPRDVDSLVAAMMKFIRDGALVETMGARARAFAEEKYDVRKVNAAMLSEMGL